MSPASRRQSRHPRRAPNGRRLGQTLLLLIAASLPACSPVKLLNAATPSGGVQITRDIPYGPDPRQKLDVYRPDHPAAAIATVVFLYGGGWNSGSKANYLFVAATLARHGLLVFVPDYGLYPAIRYPVFLQDCALATVWAQSHAARYGGSASNIFLMGHSAGAYNAAMLTLDPEWLHQAGGSPTTLRGMIGLAGPYDFLPMTGADTRAVFASHADDTLTQPIHYATGNDPPLLLLQGTDDTTVYPKNLVHLAAAIRADGGVVETHLYPGIAHIGIVLSLTPLFSGKDTALADTLDFIARHRRP